MQILDRYLGSVILKYTLITMMVLLGLFIFVSFLDQLVSIGKGSYQSLDAIIYVALSIPRMIYDLFPMAALLGTIIGLSILANDSELIVMRSSGISMLQITRAVFKIGALFVLVAILIGEFVSPITETKAQRGRAEALHEDIRQKKSFGLWIRDDQTYVNIGEVLPDLTLLGVKVFELEQHEKIRSLVNAKEGLFQDDHWMLVDVQKTRITDSGEVEALQMDAMKWQSQITPKILSLFLVKPDQLSFMQLYRYIRHLTQNQQKAGSYELAFWNKIMLPLSTAVMVVLAIPFVFTNIRSGALGRNLFIGIMLGIGFYAANRSFGYLVLASDMPSFIGATVPVGAFLLLAIVMIKRVG